MTCPAEVAMLAPEEEDDLPKRNSFTIYRGDKDGWFPVVSDGHKKLFVSYAVALDNYTRLKGKRPEYGWAIKDNKTGKFSEPEV